MNVLAEHLVINCLLKTALLVSNTTVSSLSSLPVKALVPETNHELTGDLRQQKCGDAIADCFILVLIWWKQFY